MNKDLLKQKIASYQEQMQQAIANYNVMLGRKVECEAMLAELINLESEVPKNNDAEADAA